jgi:predicted transcriptional regulator
MEHERRLFEETDSVAEEKALQRAREDIAAGRFVSHEEVAKWLRTWGKPDEKPMPPEWRR